MNPLLIKIGVKIATSEKGRAVLSKALQNSLTRFNTITRSLLPSNNEYLKGRDVSSTVLPLSGLVGLINSTSLSPNIQRLQGCAEQADKVVPFDTDKTVIQRLDDICEAVGKPLPDSIRKAISLNPLMDATPRDLRDGLSAVLGRIKDNPNTQNLASIVNLKLASTVMHGITDRSESSLTDEQLMAMKNGMDSFEANKDKPMYQRGMDSLGPNPWREN